MDNIPFSYNFNPLFHSFCDSLTMVESYCAHLLKHCTAVKFQGEYFSLMPLYPLISTPAATFLCGRLSVSQKIILYVYLSDGDS